MMQFTRTIPILLAMLVLGSVAPIEAPAQSPPFRIVPIAFETERFPIVAASFYLVDSSGTSLSDLQVGDFEILENGAPREAVFLRCPPHSRRPRLSSLLALDVSASMASGDRLTMAREAARAWIDELDFGYSEAAILAFDHEATLLHDFTTSHERLTEALERLAPRGGTSFDQALLSDPLGALRIAARGSNERVVVFLTDGQAAGSFGEMIALANARDITVHVVLLQAAASQGLRDLAEETGGLLFEQVESAEEARILFRLLLNHSRGVPPCRLQWLGSNECAPSRDVTIRVPLYDAEWSGRITIPSERFPSLRAVGSPLRFGPHTPGTRPTLTTTIVAEGGDVLLQQLELSQGPFSLRSVDPALPHLLKEGEGITVTIEYAPTDSSSQVVVLESLSDACSGASLLVSGGAPGVRGGPSIRLTSPNGGERYHTGERLKIEWDGIPSGDTVLLEYSVDGGERWRTITEEASGGEFEWRAPFEVTDRALVRATRLSAEAGRGVILLPAPDRVWSVAWSPGEALIAVGSERGIVQLRDGADGSLIREYPSPDTSVILSQIGFSPDGEEILLNGTGLQLYLISLGDGTVRSIQLPARADRSIISPDGRQVISVAGAAGRIFRHDRASRQLVEEISFPLDLGVSDLRLRPDGTLLLAGGDDSVRIFDLARSEIVGAYSTGMPAVSSADYSPRNGRLLVTGSSPGVELYDDPSMVPFTVIPTVSGARVGRFSRDGRLILHTGSHEITDRPFDIEAYDRDRQNRDRTLVGHTGLVTSVEVATGSDRVLSGGLDSAAILWDLPNVPVGTDRSDATFSIVATRLTVGTIDFGDVRLGEYASTVGRRVICNEGVTWLWIDSLFLGEGDFTLRGGELPVRLAPGECLDVEVEFSPGHQGPHMVPIYVVAGAYRAEGSVTGVGTAEGLPIAALPIDFGTNLIGSESLRIDHVIARNTGTEPVVVDGVEVEEGNSAFTFDSSPMNLLVPPGEEIRIDGRYIADRRGYQTGRYRIRYHHPEWPEKRESSEAPLIGEGECDTAGPVVRLAPGTDLHAAPGDRFKLPLIINGDRRSLQTGGAYSLLISWNSNLAALDSADHLPLLDGDRAFALLRGRYDGTSDTLAFLPLVIALGPDTINSITVHEIRFESECDGGAETGEGILHLDDLCRESETRLFHASESIILRSVVPNPVRSTGRVVFRTIEPGPVKISLIDADGRSVRDLSRGTEGPGEFTIELDVEGFPAGRYYLRIGTETQDMITPVVIQK